MNKQIIKRIIYKERIVNKDKYWTLKNVNVEWIFLHCFSSLIYQSYIDCTWSCIVNCILEHLLIDIHSRMGCHIVRALGYRSCFPSPLQTWDTSCPWPWREGCLPVCLDVRPSPPCATLGQVAAGPALPHGVSHLSFPVAPLKLLNNRRIRQSVTAAVRTLPMIVCTLILSPIINNQWTCNVVCCHWLRDSINWVVEVIRYFQIS